MEQQSKEISHVDLLVELRVLQNDLDSIKKAIDKITDTQAEEIKILRDDIKNIKNDHINLKVRMGQVLAVSGLLALVIPIIINLASTRVEFGHRYPSITHPNE